MTEDEFVVHFFQFDGELKLLVRPVKINRKVLHLETD